MLRLTVAIAVVGVALLSGVPVRRYNQGAISEGMNVQATGGNLGPEKHSCSTFLLPAGDTLLVGHNVDDDYVIPGAVVVNKHGVQKESTSWEADLLTLFGRSHKAPRARWTSKYGSITYNTFGKEGPDGGMNEAGLYVGEMTLTQVPTVPPKNDLPKMYPHLWIQYLLDNYATVDEVIASLEKVSPGGPQTWHFFIADRQGHTAAIEFLESGTAIYKNKEMPVKVMTNPPYAQEMEKLRGYEGFGGQAAVDLDDRNSYRGFVWAAALLDAYATSGATDAVAYAFDVLEALEWDNNQWAVVYDVHKERMYFRTAQAHRIRFVDVSGFDFSCETPAMMLDIQQDLEGDVSGSFVPHTDKLNKAFIKAAIKPIEIPGMPKFAGDIFKFFWADRLHRYTKGFSCAP